MFCENLKFSFRLLVNYLPQTPTESKRKFCNFFSSYASPKLNTKNSSKDFYVLEAVIFNAIVPALFCFFQEP